MIKGTRTNELSKYLCGRIRYPIYSSRTLVLSPLVSMLLMRQPSYFISLHMNQKINTKITYKINLAEINVILNTMNDFFVCCDKKKKLLVKWHDMLSLIPVWVNKCGHKFDHGDVSLSLVSPSRQLIWLRCFHVQNNPTLFKIWSISPTK